MLKIRIVVGIKIAKNINAKNMYVLFYVATLIQFRRPLNIFLHRLGVFKKKHNKKDLLCSFFDKKLLLKKHILFKLHYSILQLPVLKKNVTTKIYIQGFLGNVHS